MTDRTQERQHAHALFDKLSDEQLDAVRNLLEVMVEPVSRSLVLVEDEEITPETAAALDRARAIDRETALQILHWFAQLHE